MIPDRQTQIQRYLDSGFLLTPLNGKDAFLKEWNSRAADDAEVREFLAQATNVGIRLGAPSGNLLDIDLDCDEAVRAARHLLPTTGMVSGRESNPSSHYWYVVDGEFKNEQVRDSSGHMLLEFRGTGLQTMVPPSIHPSGELLRWFSSGAPARVGCEEILGKFHRLAAATILARNWPKGSRHECAMCLAGGLLNAGWSRDETREFVTAVCAGAQDEESRDRLASVGATDDRIDDDKPVTGWPSLAKLVGDNCVERVLKYLGIKSTPRASRGSSKYGADEKGIYHLVFNGEGSSREYLTNFTAKIVKEVRSDDGHSTSLVFVVEGELLGTPFSLEIPAREFNSMEWVTTRLGAQAVIEPRKQDRACAAIKSLSGDCAKETRYGHSGWHKVGDEWMFLHRGGAVGPNGAVDTLLCTLPSRLQPVALSIDESRLAEDYKALVRLRHLAPSAVVLPLLGATFRTPVEACGLNLIIEGRTGTRKTAVAALFQSFFGAGFDNTHLPLSFAGTANGMEPILHAGKDLLLVIDDYCPRQIRFDAEREEDKLDRLCRSNAEGFGRDRGTKYGGLIEGRPPRCTIVATAETLPAKCSLRARVGILSQGDGVTDLALLTQCQRDAADGCFARIMAAFIAHIARDRDAILVRLRVRESELRAKAQRDGHGRIPEMQARLIAGMELLAEFLVAKQLCSEADAKQLVVDLESELQLWRIEQADLVQIADPIEIVLRGLHAALASGQAHLSTRLGTVPPVAPELRAAWGWRPAATIAHPEQWQPQGMLVGTVDGDELRLFHQTAIEVSRKALGVEGSAVPDPRRFVSELARRGWLTRTDTARGENVTRLSLGGKRSFCVTLSLRQFLAFGGSEQPEDAA